MSGTTINSSLAAQPSPELMKPRFSCGQMLTDGDLTALVDWTEAKSSLARRGHGWGVVWGLGLANDGQEGRLILQPGYAVDAAGRDIVVPAAAVISLDDCCWTPRSAGPESSSNAVEPADFRVMKVENYKIVDLRLHYAEAGSTPRAALGGVSCGGTSASEYTRLRQTFRAECVEGNADTDPLQRLAKNWEDEYRKCFTVVRRYRADCAGQSSTETHRWWLRWVERNPLHSLCFLRSWIEGRNENSWDEKVSAEALFWLVQDQRNWFLQQGCDRIAGDEGVPLARVWVRMPVQGERKQYRVLAIDSHPPYRRLVESNPCWPAARGHINIANAFWRRSTDAHILLAASGLRLQGQEPYSIPETTAALEAALDASKVAVECDSEVRLWTIKCGDLRSRVVDVQVIL